jgi:hypothetical protein
MPLREIGRNESANENTQDNESLIHVHRVSDTQYILVERDEPRRLEVGGAPYECPGCSEEDNTVLSYGEYDVECDECDRMFRSESAKNGHKSTHGDDE